MNNRKTVVASLDFERAVHFVTIGQLNSPVSCPFGKIQLEALSMMYLQSFDGVTGMSKTSYFCNFARHSS